MNPVPPTNPAPPPPRRPPEAEPLPPAADALLRRDRDALLGQLLAVRGAWAPDWLPEPGGAGHGLADILAGHLEQLGQRLAQVPDHRLSVLLDLLGVSPLPAQGARGHILLTAIPGTRGARIPAGTRFGAPVAGRDAPVVFETQHDVAISPATLAEVHSVEPGADAEDDHSADVLAHRPFTLFGAPVPVRRDLHIGHDALFAFDGRAVVEVEIGVDTPAAAPLPLAWSWWDGASWRPFTAFVPSTLRAGEDDSLDGTAGLTRSGTVRLVAPCAAAQPLDLDGRTTYWIRGRLTAPLAVPPGAPPPVLSRVRLRAVNEHRRLRTHRSETLGDTASVTVRWTDPPAPAKLQLHLADATDGTLASEPVPADGTVPLPAAGHTVRVGVSPDPARTSDPTAPVPADAPRRVAFDSSEELTEAFAADPGTRLDVTVRAGLELDKAIADRQSADLTRTFAPLGPSPARGTAFLFACAPATRRPGTRVTLVLERPVTAAEEADGLSGQQEGTVQEAKKQIDALVSRLRAATGPLTALTSTAGPLGAPLPPLVASDPAAWYAEVRGRVREALLRLRTASSGTHSVFGQTGEARTQLDAAIRAADAKPGARDAHGTLEPTPRAAARVLLDLAGATQQLAADTGGLTGPLAALTTAVASGADADVQAAEPPLAAALAAVLTAADPFLPAGTLPPFLASDPAAFAAAVAARLSTAAHAVDSAAGAMTAVATTLDQMSPDVLLKKVIGTASPQLTPPEVAWEYHDGRRWRSLGAEGDPEVLALRAPGSVGFTVPDDIAAVDVDGDERRWLRARLAAGSFSHLRLVSWTDKSGVLNFLPVVEPRAPQLDRIQVFYTHRSAPSDPGAVVVHDDHTWRDLTADVTWPAAGAAPFRPMPETGPTLYLGLDGELPADRVGIWLRPAAPSPRSTPHRPVWEGHDGTDWVRLATDDGTDGLRRTGVVGLVWPGTPGTGGATVTGALGRTVTLLGRGGAPRFSPGDRLVLADTQGQEPLVVAAVADQTVTTREPLSRPYTGGRLRPAPPARFGRPRTWIRAVFDRTLPPPRLALTGLAAHAVEVAQTELLRDELLGSGDGSPRQVLTSRRSPVTDDVELEVRELAGEYADLDADVLARSLAADGADPARTRTVRDARTGRLTEVWVPWTAVASLGSAGPRDRVFVVDHALGRFLFGGAGHGRALPEGRDNVQLRSYRTCEGALGNVPAGTITQLLSAAGVSEAANPDPATGGADVEPPAAVLRRGPGLLRHRRLALTEADVEAVALAASPAVVRARAVGAADRWGRPAPGAVRVLVVPRDGTPAPRPGPALLAAVHTAVIAASPAAAAARITVEGPHYTPVGVQAAVIPLRPDDAGPTREAAVAAVEEFLHPLRGGPDGTGWDFGRGVHVSDVARLLESLPGVDAVTDLVLTRDEVPVGTLVLRPDDIVCAGPVVVRLEARS
ncbi:baseplate J/gp47 family protein [Streptomyces sp. NPDC005931]|uniref:baseplate J/gp47 family protein n=1 Tax=Streptomyces sp. NPDC005931 TaxID=3364737 RepID=UPI0036AA91CC